MIKVLIFSKNFWQIVSKIGRIWWIWHLKKVKWQPKMQDHSANDRARGRKGVLGRACALSFGLFGLIKAMTIEILHIECECALELLEEKRDK